MDALPATMAHGAPTASAIGWHTLRSDMHQRCLHAVNAYSLNPIIVVLCNLCRCVPSSMSASIWLGPLLTTSWQCVHPLGVSMELVQRDRTRPQVRVGWCRLGVGWRHVCWVSMHENLCVGIGPCKLCMSA